MYVWKHMETIVGVLFQIDALASRQNNYFILQNILYLNILTFVTVIPVEIVIVTCTFWFIHISTVYIEAFGNTVGTITANHVITVTWKF